MMKTLAAAVVGLSVGLGGASAVLAKAHDQGVADGTRIDPSVLRGGGVAGVDEPGVGRDADGNFLGVAADLELDQNYGQTIVQQQVADGTRRIDPKSNPNGFPPGKVK